ncbi:hypothetical protein N7471_011218 [Penicillium samsonianum]|uniref:uncharacterized protein n=1 Tax=Penicillium samsonianum TaxID=1882272 RepID=UPI0025486D90|nr:uncharacterized protein N7471_011218 [Penicillium samsonianum]KAJ6123901.1 hypothetical protein N7471_011218 [Penicillium samsonianum]
MILTSLSRFWSCLTTIFLGGGLWPYGVHGQTTEFNTSVQSETGFMGWYLGPSATEAMTDAHTWTTSGNYAVGCDGTSCRFATNCNNNQITYDDGATGSCDSATCVTMTIFQTFPYATPSASNIFCGFHWEANTIYRELQATTTTESTSSPTPSTTTSQRSPTATTGLAKDSQASQSPTPTVAPTTTSSSKAWIAGAVIGPLAGVAIIAALVFWRIYRRKQKEPSLSQEQPFMSHGPPQPPQPPAGYPLEPYKQMHELPNTQTPRVYELGSNDER